MSVVIFPARSTRRIDGTGFASPTRNAPPALGWVELLQPVTPGRLAEETGMPATTIRDYIREVVERGDVRKVANPEDGRSYLLELTEQGKALADSGRPALGRALERLEPFLRRPPTEYIDVTVELRLALRQALAG